MQSKYLSIFLVVCGLSGVCLAGYAEYSGQEGYGGGQEYAISVEKHHGLPHHGEEDHHFDYHAYPKYSYDYSVKDPHTGDQKEHWETRDGDKVKGSYSLLEADGTKRIVEYESDKENGFNAVVHHVGEPKEQPTIKKTSGHPVQYADFADFEHYQGGY